MWQPAPKPVGPPARPTQLYEPSLGHIQAIVPLPSISSNLFFRAISDPRP